jgi:hypothetical protein
MPFRRFTGPEMASQKEHPILDIPHELRDGKRIISGGTMLIGYARVSTLDQNLDL